MKPYTGDATCPKCDTAWEGTNITYCDGRRCKALDTDWRRHAPMSEHLHCTCEECGYGWLMECADAGPSPEPSHEIVCPACDATLLLLSEDLDPVHVAYCKLKDLEGDHVIMCPRCARVTYRSVSEVYDES